MEIFFIVLHKFKQKTHTVVSLLSQAITSYDYIVFYKQYAHEDFINRQDSATITQYSYNQTLYSPTKKDKNTLLIVVIVVSSLSLIAILVVLT